MGPEERLSYVEFRMDLLREGSEFSHFVYDCKITQDQLTELYNIMDYFMDKVDNNEDVSHVEYEARVLEVVDNMTFDYHFCENFARLLWEEQRYDNVFPALYGHEMKFKHLFK